MKIKRLSCFSDYVDSFIFVSLCFTVFIFVPVVACAGFWDDEPKPETVTLDQVVEKLSETLSEQAGLVRGKPVLISSNDFFDAGSGLSLPLAIQLRGKFITCMKRYGARVLLPGSDEDKYLILQGTWQKEGKFLALDMKIMGLNKDGPEVVAAASGKILLKRLDEAALVADLDSWGRYLVRKLENRVRNRRRHTVYLRKFKPKGELSKQGDLALYLSDWLRPALAESNLFRVVDPQVKLKNLSTSELKERGFKQNPDKSLPPDAGQKKSSLTADLLLSDSELWGSAWINHGKLEIRASILGLTGSQISAANVSVPKDLLPGYLVNANKAKDAKKDFPVSDSSENSFSYGGLKVEISTDRGENSPVYWQGEHIRFLVRLNRDAWVYIFYLNSDDSALPLYPLDYRNQPKTDSQKLKANKLLVLPDDGCPYDLKVSKPFGIDQVMVVASEKRIEIPSVTSAEWQSAENFFKNLRKKSLKNSSGYAERRIQFETKAR